MESRFSFRSALVGGLVAALLVSSAPVVAAVGDAVLAGRTTRADQMTHLKGDVSSHNLRITNTNPDGTAARFVVQAGNPPFEVNSRTRVAQLNADRLDGKNASAFLTKNAYDNDKDGVVDSADIKVRYADAPAFFSDMGAAVADRMRCVTDPVSFDSPTTVIASGSLSLNPTVASTASIYGFTHYSGDGGTTWPRLNGAGVEDNPAGQGRDAAVPINAAGVLPAGTYLFAIFPVGNDLQAGSDYLGYCELTIMALTGLGSTTDVIVNSAGLDELDRTTND